jgi:hypothetical protein
VEVTKADLRSNLGLIQGLHDLVAEFERRPVFGCLGSGLVEVTKADLRSNLGLIQGLHDLVAEFERRPVFGCLGSGLSQSLGVYVFPLPPRDNVPIPSVDDHFHILIEQIAFDNFDFSCVHR